MQSIICVSHLAKTYASGFHALQDINLDIRRGEIFALLGPNGAGKTSTIEILEGFRERDAGRVEVLGYDPAERSTSRALRERLGIVLQELAVEPFLTVREVVQRQAGFYPAPRDVDEVIGLIGLTSKAHARVKTLSGGQQRRLDVGLGIVGRPDLVFLDEPTTGFDPSARRGAWELVRTLRSQGATIVLTTHYMDEAEALADRVAVLDKGQLVALGSPASLGERETATAHIEFRLPGGVDVDDLPAGIAAAISGDRVKIETSDEVHILQDLTRWALDTGNPLPGLTVQRLTLEDVYLRLTGGADAAADQ
jgi:ABC-2 type transport system ATP-binding protein